MSTILVRKATRADAAGALDVLRSSITRLCIDDHHNDPETLEAWLHNKTEQGFRLMLDNHDLHFVVAELPPCLAGVGAIDASGQINLLYVHPNFLRRGVGNALLAELERQAMTWGLHEVTLASTASARRFYEHHGYTSTGPPQPCWGVVRAFPFAKPLPRD